LKFPKSVVVFAAVSSMFWAPSILPAKAAFGVSPGCGRWFFAPPVFAPTPAVAVGVPIVRRLVVCVSSAHAPAPYAPFAVVAGAASIMLNAAIVWNTQCRELSLDEAMNSAFLPLVGIAFDQHASKCARH
jgi:hypothetical protein